MWTLRKTNVVLLIGTLMASIAAAGGGAGDTATYDGPGTVVASLAGLTIVDNGAVVCEDGEGDGVHESGRGGACLRFDRLAGDSILVQDAAYGYDVAFQVCVDANADFICGGEGIESYEGGARPRPGDCRDLILFSHGSDGSYHNPLLVPSWAQDHWADCGGGFAGLVVITCAGLHQHGFDVHTHEVTQGVVQSVSGGSGYGNFCGAPAAAKAYALT